VARAPNDAGEDGPGRIVSSEPRLASKPTLLLLEHHQLLNEDECFRDQNGCLPSPYQFHCRRRGAGYPQRQPFFTYREARTNATFCQIKQELNKQTGKLQSYG